MIPWPIFQWVVLALLFHLVAQFHGDQILPNIPTIICAGLAGAYGSKEVNRWLLKKRQSKKQRRVRTLWKHFITYGHFNRPAWMDEEPD